MLICFVVYCAFGVLVTSGLVDPGPRYPATKGEVWPRPAFELKEQFYYTLNPARLKIKVTNQTCNILTEAVERYCFILRNTMKVHGQRGSTSRNRRRVPADDIINNMNNVTNTTNYHRGLFIEFEIELSAPCERYPYFNMDESYDLTISSTTKKLSSNSIWGILRGLETWTQLFYFTDDYNEIRINATHIMDYPRYPHRGLLLDTSRHFVTLSNILKTLDAMAMNKMNVFHWHIVDDQSFPYQSEVFPDLSGKGAYHSTLIYSKKDIQLVINYARNRGIRVLPEFDVPGHTRSWGEAFPNVLTKCYNRRGQITGLGPMHPIRNTTYKLLQDLIKEIQEWFPDRYFHVGGDEVELDCWASNPELKIYMKNHNLTTSDLHGLFMANVIPLLGNRSLPIVWQEVYDEGVKLSLDTIIQVWKWGWIQEMVQVLNAGHKLIFSSSWYLDHLQSGGDWTDFYVADPRAMLAGYKSITPDLLQNILGGEACMWGEVVDDTNVISRVWPRASAVAERLWSKAMDSDSFMTCCNSDAKVADEVRHRIEEHTCRMRRRGVRAQPPNGPGVCVGAV